MGKKKRKPAKPAEERVRAVELIGVYDELDQLREQYPEAARAVNPNYGKKNLLERLLGFYQAMRARFYTENEVNRRVYLWLHLLGVVGAHHFYARHWIKGLLYLAICWTGVSAGLTLIDWMAAFPKKPDEYGQIVV